VSKKPNEPRNHHYVPQCYLQNFSVDGEVYAFRSEELRHFRPSCRNIAGKRDLYRLEGPEPLLAEKMFGEIEDAISPILSKVIADEQLPLVASDEFISLLSFIAIMEMRNPKNLTNIENFRKKVMKRAVELASHHIPEQGKKLIDGQIVTREEVKSAVKAFDEGRIRIHVPMDQTLATSLNAVQGITETLLQRQWTLAIAQENSFITTSKPVLLVWDDLKLHLNHSAGFGLKNTTVYFAISPKLMMVGRFHPMHKTLSFDSDMVAEINGYHGIFSPALYISKTNSSLIRIGSELVPFNELATAMRRLNE